MVNITKEACEIATSEQMFALYNLHNNSIDMIFVQKGGFDLPNGYLAFSQHYKETGPDMMTQNPIYGGIAPDGRVST